MVTNVANRRKIVHFIVQNLQLATDMAWQTSRLCFNTYVGFWWPPFPRLTVQQLLYVDIGLYSGP